MIPVRMIICEAQDFAQPPFVCASDTIGIVHPLILICID